jgi:hypothetical protein
MSVFHIYRVMTKAWKFPETEIHFMFVLKEQSANLTNRKSPMQIYLPRFIEYPSNDAIRPLSI